MPVYFAVIGGLFYKIFIKSPYEKKTANDPDKLIIAKEKTGNLHA